MLVDNPTHLGGSNAMLVVALQELATPEVVALVESLLAYGSHGKGESVAGPAPLSLSLAPTSLA